MNNEVFLLSIGIVSAIFFLAWIMCCENLKRTTDLIKFRLNSFLIGHNTPIIEKEIYSFKDSDIERFRVKWLKYSKLFPFHTTTIYDNIVFMTVEEAKDYVKFAVRPSVMLYNKNESGYSIYTITEAERLKTFVVKDSLIKGYYVVNGYRLEKDNLSRRFICDFPSKPILVKKVVVS